MTRPYKPIACGVHDELLSIATRARECEITYRDDAGEQRTARSRIIDVYTRGAEEFLKLEQGLVIRLDMLTAVDGRELPSQ